MMPIVVGVDTTAAAKEVVLVALRMAELWSTQLVLVRAVGVPGELPIEAYAVSPADLVTVLRERATKEVEFLAEDVPSERLRGIVVDVGRAWEVICEQARRADAAMIVIGAHGYGNIDRLLGTTAARVVNHADRSVVVVRAPERVLGS